MSRGSSVAFLAVHDASPSRFSYRVCIMDKVEPLERFLLHLNGFGHCESTLKAVTVTRTPFCVDQLLDFWPCAPRRPLGSRRTLSWRKSIPSNESPFYSEIISNIRERLSGWVSGLGSLCLTHWLYLKRSTKRDIKEAVSQAAVNGTSGFFFLGPPRIPFTDLSLRSSQS